MGTNYYLRKPEGEVCEHCSRGDGQRELHIGKASYGWKFIFDTNYGEINSFKEWEKL